MLFGVHNWYNNNSGGMGDFSHPKNSCLISELEVRVTDQGLTIFNLDKREQLGKKLEIAKALDGALRDEFGVGISFATCSSSDCVREFELIPYYNRIKEINPEIVTIYTTNKYRSFGGEISTEEWVSCPEDLQVDHIVDQWGKKPTAEKIVEILHPGDEDRSEPPEGWRVFEKRLWDIYDQVVESVLNPQNKSEHHLQVLDGPDF